MPITSSCVEIRLQDNSSAVGRRLGDQVEVTSGLQGEATIVSQGAGFLNDGDLVKVTSLTSPVAAPTLKTTAPAAAAVGVRK